MPKKNDKAVTKRQETDITKFDYGEDEGQGYEHQTGDDIAMPFIACLQALSPQVVDETVEGAKPGKLMNTVTEQLYPPEGVLFVPCTSLHHFIEWVPRDEGGGGGSGFVGTHAVNSDVVKKAREESSEFGKLKSDAGNDLVETFQYFGLLCDESEPIGPAVIAFDSTKIKVYKKMNSQLQAFMIKQGDRKVKPPMFSHVLRLTTVPDENKKGKFHNFKLEPANGDIKSSLMAPTDPRYQTARKIKEMVDEGTAFAVYESNQQDGEGDPPF